MRAKADLAPDCDIHGEPMYRDECPAAALGLPGGRDIIVWRCARPGCGRFFEGAVGYRRSLDPRGTPTPRCTRHRAFLVVQQGQARYICPVAGCAHQRPWNVSASVEAEPHQTELVSGRVK